MTADQPETAATASLRVGVDLSIMRHGPSGSARWASGLVGALRERSDVELRTWLGPARRRFPGPLRKVLNAAQDRVFYESLLPTAAARWGADVLLMPVNLTARRGGIRQVVSILDLNFLVEPASYDPWFRAYASRMFARAAREADVITTISAYSRSQLCEHLGVDEDRVRVVYPGLTPPPAVPGAPPLDRPYALALGPTEPHKNIGLLLDAWGVLNATDLVLVIAGKPGRAHAALEARASALGQRVLITGQLDTLDLERWFRGASVFLFPSLAEGFGYPPLEAMARGVPVISSNAASMPEVLGDAALYHDPDDPDELVRSVELLAANRELRNAQIARGLAQAARYPWPKTAASMVEALAAAVGGGRRAAAGHGICRRGR